MTKDNADIKYDPELPFAYLDNGGEQLYARFKHRGDAEMFRAHCNFGTVIDTTPKPKIPEDAQYILVEDGIDSLFAYRGDGYWIMVGNGIISESGLLEYIADDDVVTVMVRKDET